MKVECWMIGKTDQRYLETGIQEYDKRIRRYLPFGLVVLSQNARKRKSSYQETKKNQSEKLLSTLTPSDYLILLDEGGREMSSEQFASFVQKSLLQPKQRLIFLIGGAYGVSEQVFERADMRVSLSRMTFSHQLVRLVFLEQLYRAMTILKNEPYHHP